VRKAIFFFIFLLCLVSIFTQGYDEEHYTVDWLRNLNTYGINQSIGKQLVMHDDLFAWAASCFPPDTDPPPYPEDILWSPMGIFAEGGKCEATAAEIEAYDRYNNWKHLYAPFKALDGKNDTAWVENNSGQGINEVIVVAIDCTQSISIWAGFGKNDTLFYKNNRPKRIRVYVIEILEVAAGQTWDTLSDLKIKAKKEIVLNDVNGYQHLDLPEFKLEKKHGSRLNTLLAIEILSVYPGTTWNDTCISEITVR
jgi:hypothetical protein